MKTTHTTSMTARILIAAAFALGLAATALHAQESDAISASTGKSQGFFAYADYFQYKGAGAPGHLVAEESVINIYNVVYVADSLTDEYTATIPELPSGNMLGGTVGYTWNDKKGNRHLIQGGYRSGNIDATISRMVAAIYNNYTYLGDIASDSVFKQKTHEYRIMYSFSPAKINFLTVGAEFVHSSYDGRFRQTINDFGRRYLLLPAGDVWNYGYTSSANDVLAHVTLKAPDIRLLENQAGGLWLLPRVDAGLGYSMRSGSIDDIDSFGVDDPKAMLDKDSAVFETTLTLGLTYTLKSSRIILDLGYRFRTDLGSSKYGTDQKGSYARAGYSYNW